MTTNLPTFTHAEIQHADGTETAYVGGAVFPPLPAYRTADYSYDDGDDRPIDGVAYIGAPVTESDTVRTDG